MTYTILKASSSRELETMVRSHLREGYSLMGGISVVPNKAFAVGALKDLRADTVLNLEEFSYELLYCQAVMLYEE